MKNTYKNLIIFSMEKSNKTMTENHNLSNKARHALSNHGFEFIESKGVYTHLNGQQSSEASFIVPMPDLVDSDRYRRIKSVILELTKDQESIIFQSTDGIGHLWFNDGTVKTLGKYTVIDSTSGVNSYTSVNGTNFVYK